MPTDEEIREKISKELDKINDDPRNTYRTMVLGLPELVAIFIAVFTAGLIVGVLIAEWRS